MKWEFIVPVTKLPPFPPLFCAPLAPGTKILTHEIWVWPTYACKILSGSVKICQSYSRKANFEQIHITLSCICMTAYSNGIALSLGAYKCHLYSVFSGLFQCGLLTNSIKAVERWWHIFKKKSRSPDFRMFRFYSARNAGIASAVVAMAIPSVRLSVCHAPVLCQNDGTCLLYTSPSPRD